MASVRDPTQANKAAFELERAEWTSADRLEIAGRWFGVRGLRFIRPTLQVEVDGEPRRMLAVLDHKPWAAEDGETWTAAFAWQGEPVDLAGSELTVAPSVAVELVPPGKDRPVRRRVARPSRADVLESDLAATRDEARGLARELDGARAVHAAELERRAATHTAELERLRAEWTAAEQEAKRRIAELSGDLRAERARVARLEGELREARGELTAARAEELVQRSELDRERAAIAAQAAKAGAEETERLRRELDAAIGDSTNARAERAAASRESVSARAERDAAIRDRDRAQQERNTLLTRIRSNAQRQSAQPPAAVPARSSPPAALETRPALPSEDLWTPRGSWDRSGPRARPSARIAVAVALIVLAAVIALLLAQAL